MGLQAHPGNNKRTFEGLEEPTGRAQHHNYQPQQNAARAAKQQCTIRVGVEAPDHLTVNGGATHLTPTCTESWSYRDQQQPQPEFESYMNGFTSAEARASTPFSGAATPVTTASYSETVASDYSAFSSGSQVYSNQSVYQNLASMVPPPAESLTDRFERVCSSPRPYVQDATNTSASAPYGGYNGASASNEAGRAEERYWSFGYSAQCPKKSAYPKCSNYGYSESSSSNNFKTATNGYQQIQRDENGKSYLELGAKAAVQPEWRPMWPAPPPVNNAPATQQQQHFNNNNIVSTAVKTCTKCGHVLSQQRSLPPAQPCYRHQRLSVLSLSMLKLNRYRQCSDPSLHRSVLICNTLRHIEDEMEREGLVCNPAAESSSSMAATSNNCDTCCCSHCGTVFSTNGNAAPAPPPPPPPPPPSLPSPKVEDTIKTASVYETPSESFNNNNATASVSDEDDSGFGDDDSRDIDWSSVFSMSTTSGFDVSAPSGALPANTSSSTTTTTYLCSDLNTSESNSLFSGSTSGEAINDSVWKSGNSSSSTWSSSDDMPTARWKSDLGDELEGFVHILVGS